MKKLLFIMGIVGLFLLTSCDKKDEPEKVNVVFESNGGTPISTITKKSEVDFNNLPETTKTGYTFEGWFIDSELTKDVENNIPKNFDLTLYAKWNINRYTISFNSNGGSSVSDITEPYNTSVNLPTPTRDDYLFIGWSTSSNLSNPVTSITIPANDVTLYAKWEAITYQVTFNSNAGSAVAAQEIFIHDSALEPTAPTKTGYTFVGWYSDSELISEYDFSTEIISDITLYAKWQINQYTISFVSGAEISVTSITADYNKIISAPDTPIRTGYTFIGWYVDEELNAPYVFDRMPAMDITLYAKWLAGNATVSFNTNGGSTLEPITVQIDSTITPPSDPTKLGYDFRGWYINADCTQAFTDWVMPVGGLTLYAKWTPAIVTITFDSLGGSSVSEITAPYLSDITEPAQPTKAGYYFNGWYIDQNFNTLFNFLQMPAEDIRVYAYWIDENEGMSIRNIKTKASYTDIITTGVVLSKLGNDYLGFYIADNTGQIFVNYDQSLVSIGDEIRITGSYILLNGIPMIVSISEFEILSHQPQNEPTNELSVDLINQIDHVDLNNYAKLIKTSGILTFSDGYYYMNDGLGHRIKLSHYSYMPTSLTTLDMALNQYIELNVILHQFDTTTSSWVATFIIDSLQVITKSDTDKLNLISTYILNQYQNTVYRPNDEFTIPTSDAYGWSTISYHAVGGHADLYDPVNQLLLEPTSDTTVEFQVTITVGIEEITIDLTVALKNSVSTILEFINATDDNRYTIIGIVTFVSNYEGFSHVTDDTGTILVDTEDLSIGDQVKITAPKSTDGPCVYIDNETITELVVLSANNTFDQTPTQMSLEALYQIDENDPTIYGQYVEIRGLLGVDEYSEHYYLYDDDYTIYIYNGAENSYGMLNNSTGIEVILKGYLLYIHDEVRFVFYGYRDQLNIPDYTDEELVYCLQELFMDQYEGRVFYPYDKFELLPYHPVLGGKISWSFSTETQALVDPETNQFIDVTEEHPIEINILIEQNQASLAITYLTTLKPFHYATLEELNGMISYTFAYIGGVVLYHDYYVTYVKHGDEISRIYGDIPAFKGDHIVVKAYKNYDEDEHSMYIDPDDYFFKVNHRYNAYEIEPEILTIDDFNDYWQSHYYFYNDYIQVSGQLKDINGNLLLTDGQNEIHIETCDGYTEDNLLEYVEQNITIKAYVLGYNSDTDIWTVYYTGRYGELEETTYTDQEKHDMLEDYITHLYQDVKYEGGNSLYFETTHPFIDATISYNAIGENAVFVNIPNNTIYAVNEETQVSIEVTITVNQSINTFIVTLTIVPEGANTIQVLTIAEFKNSSGETLTTEGVIVSVGSGYILIQDDTGRIFVETTHYYSKNDLWKLLRITGQITHHQGRPEIDENHEATIVFQNRFKVIDYPETPLKDIVKYDFNRISQYGKDVTITGVVTAAMDENYYTYYYLTDGYDRVMLDGIQSYYFYDYVGYEITIKGFIYGQKQDINEHIWTINVLPPSLPAETLHDYTTEELIDIIGSGIVETYDGGIYNSYSSIYLTSNHSLIYYAEIDYQVMNDPNYVIQLYRGTIGGVEEDTEFEIKVSIELSDITKDFYFTITVRGTRNVTIGELTDPNGVPYEDVTTSIQYFYGVEGTKYYLSEGKIYVLNDYYYYPYGIQEGEFVYLSGVKNVIDDLGGFGYDIGMVYADEDTGQFAIESYPISISQIYNTDLEIIDLTEKYLKVYGQLLYDDIMDMYYIEHENHMLYIRATEYEMSLFSYFNYLNNHVNNLVYLEVLFPNITVRGDIYLVDYKVTDTSLSYPDLSPFERIMATKSYLERTYDNNTYKPNDNLNLLNYHNIYGTDIIWSYNSPYLVDNTFLYGTTRESVTFDVIISYTENEYTHPTHNMQITVYVEPPVITPIIDVLRGALDDEYVIQGVVQEIDPYDYTMYVKDDTGIILVDYYFEGIVVGDEIIVSGYRDHFWNGNTPCLDARSYTLLKIVTHHEYINKPYPKVLTLEELEKLDYYYPDDFTQYITITGRVERLSYYTYNLVCDGFTINIDYSITDTYDGRDKLANHIGDELEIDGYLVGLESYYDDSHWMISFTGNPNDFHVINDVD